MDIMVVGRLVFTVAPGDWSDFAILKAGWLQYSVGIGGGGGGADMQI